MGSLWKKILVACVAATTLALTACSGENTGASAPPVEKENIVTLSPATDDTNNGAVQINSKTVSCAKDKGIELNVGAAKKGFSGKFITVKVEGKVTTIDWGGEGANAIIVNDRQWAYAGGNKTPMPAKTKLPHDQWGEPKKIVICGFGN